MQTIAATVGVGFALLRDMFQLVELAAGAAVMLVIETT